MKKIFRFSDFRSMWVLAAVILAIVASANIETNEVHEFLRAAIDEYTSSIWLVAKRAALLQGLARTIVDADEKAAAIAAAEFLIFKKKMMERSTVFLAQMTQGVNLYETDIERFQAQMDSTARRIYEFLDDIDLKINDAEEEASILFKELKKPFALKDAQSEYELLVQDFVNASAIWILVESKAKMLPRISKKPDVKYPSQIIEKFDDYGRRLFYQWRESLLQKMFVMLIELDELDNCLETLLDVEAAIAEGPMEINYREISIAMDNSLHFQYVNESAY